MTASTSNRIVDGKPVSEGTRVELTTRDGVVVDRPGTVIRYHSLRHPILEVALDDGSTGLAQPWRLKAIPDEH